MQYPEIQFYRGSLVRLASGQLKHVEDLSSDDFIESARLAVSSPTGKQAASARGSQQKQHQQQQININCNSSSQVRAKFDFNPPATGQFQRHPGSQNGAGGSSGTPDENNNSVFNSPEPASSCFDGSPRMKTDNNDDDEEIDVELDVVTTHDDEDKNESFGTRLHGLISNDNGNHHYQHQHQQQEHERNLNLASRNHAQTLLTKNQQQVKLEQFSSSSSAHSSSTTTPFSFSSTVTRMDDDVTGPGGLSGQEGDGQDFYIDSSVVRDFLEVGPIQQQANQQRLSAATSPASSTNSLNNQDQHNQAYSLPPSTSSSSSSTNSLQSSTSPPVVMPQILSAASPTTAQTVLIKFFLETSRSVVFIEVPIEHPFFVFHRGWSSWNPQRTYDKFGLKCRKLKIGDTCISLIRRRQNTKQQDSDQCNILFSSIKINE